MFATICTLLFLNIHMTDSQIIRFSMTNNLVMFYLRVRL